MVSLVFVMLVYVIPQFESFYEGLNAQLPTPTRILMAASGFLRENLLWLVLGLAAAVVVLIGWLRQPGSAIRVDRMLLRVPFLGRLMRMYATSQLARTLSTLLSGGLPLLNALEVGANSVGNRAMAAVATATPQIREGKGSTGPRVHRHAREPRPGDGQGGRADRGAGGHARSVAEFYDEEVDTRLATGSPWDPMLVMMAFRGGHAARLLPTALPGDLRDPGGPAVTGPAALEVSWPRN
jgi:hypothetical protein